METLKKTQILKLILILSLLIITPLLSKSLRSKYLYFIVNILILAVGEEAGLVSFFLESGEFKKSPNTHVAQTPVITSALITSEDHKETSESEVGSDEANHSVEEYCLSQKVLDAVNVKKVIRKSASTPSIFFVGGQSTEAEELAEPDVDEDLFLKAETFIGNFYEQLKIQREDSWKKLSDLYQKAF